MIDTKSKLVLTILAKECGDGGYKIIEIPDIIMALPRHFRMDSESIKHILTHLERQDIISIKYDDDDIYCLSVLPYGFEILENEKPKFIKKDKISRKNSNILLIFLCFFSSILGSSLGYLIIYFILK